MTRSTIAVAFSLDIASYCRRAVRNRVVRRLNRTIVRPRPFAGALASGHFAKLDAELARYRRSAARIAARASRRVVVVAHQVQRAVNHVQQQLVVGGPAELAAASWRAVSADDHLALEPVAVALQHEAEHVGRIVVGQILAIERVNRRIVDDRDAQLGRRSTRASRTIASAAVRSRASL